jgi:CBS domain-containing protein
MSSKDFGGELLVVEDGRVLGTITERDICLAVGAGNCEAVPAHKTSGA